MNKKKKMIGSCVQTGGLVRVKAHTRQDPRRSERRNDIKYYEKKYGKLPSQSKGLRRSTRKRYQSLDKLQSVISSGRSKLGKRKRLRAVGSGFNVY